MMRLFEMFSGYGGASFALKKASIPFECVGYSEIDKNAIKCYEQNFKGIKNYGDCIKINTNDLLDFDLLTGGFPCQDVSIAGHRDLSKGRTNLYQEILRIAEAKKPKYMLIENVKGLLSMEVDEVKLVSIIVNDLKKLGYGVAWKVLNSKDYGIPQNRERIWFVCKLGGWDFMEFQFPNPIELKIFVKDILEKEVSKKYLLSEKQVRAIQERLKLQREKGNGFGELPIDSNGTISTLTQRDYKDGGKRIKIDRIQFDVSKKGYSHGDTKGGITTPLVLFDAYNEKVMEDNKISTTLRTNWSDGNNQIINCLTEAQGRQGSSDEFLKACEKVSSSMMIFRRLTPKECFRLMGFLNDEINLEGLSDTQKYRLAGNGWDINLVSKIFKEMFKNVER